MSTSSFSLARKRENFPPLAARYPLRVDDSAAACVFAARCSHNLLGIAWFAMTTRLVFALSFKTLSSRFLKQLTVH